MRERVSSSFSAGPFVRIAFEGRENLVAHIIDVLLILDAREDEKQLADRSSLSKETPIEVYLLFLQHQLLIEI